MGPLRAHSRQNQERRHGDVACDSYHRWREDIALMRAMNLNSYRFSISWPRIQPSGPARRIPRASIITAAWSMPCWRRVSGPLVTLYHWDLPQALEDAGGWTNRDTAARFADYVQLVAQSARRPGLRLDDLQRAGGICRSGLPRRHARSRAQEPARFSTRHARRQSGAGCGISRAQGGSSA